MDAASGYYLNLYDRKERIFDPGRDVFIIFNEPNSEPTEKEIETLINLVERELEKEPTGATLEKAIMDSGLECVTFGVQIRADALKSRSLNEKIQKATGPVKTKKLPDLNDKTVEIDLPRAGWNKEYYIRYRKDNRNTPIIVEAPGIRAALRYLHSKIPNVWIVAGTREASVEDFQPGVPVLVLTEKEEREVRRNFLASDIEELDLTVRSYNCLRHANIKSIQELVSMTESELMKIRNLGWKCLDEIKDVLDKHGERLGAEVEMSHKPSIEDRIHSAALYAENEKVKEALLQSEKLRNMTLDACENIPGYTYLQREEKNKLYDMVKHSIMLSMNKGKETEWEK